MADFEKREDEFVPSTKDFLALQNRESCRSDKGTSDLRGSMFQSENLLQQVFFSEENQLILQNAIRHDVWDLSGETALIPHLNTPALLHIMNTAFQSRGWQSEENSITNQISGLNQQVISQAVPEVYSQVDSHCKYLKQLKQGIQIFAPPMPSGDREYRENRETTQF